MTIADIIYLKMEYENGVICTDFWWGFCKEYISVNVELYNVILAALCAITIVLGMGSLLIALLTVSDKLAAF